MATSKKKISEQIMLLVKGSLQKAGFNTHINEIKELVGQAINKRLKIQHYSETMAGGERIPSGALLATYESIPVVSYAGRSKVVLPGFPEELPKGIGVYQVVPIINGIPDFSCEFIPVPPGQWWMIQKEGLISDIGGMVGYERYGIELLLNRDVTKDTTPIENVLVRMAIVDLGKLSDSDILPVPADMEFDIIADVYKMLTGKPLKQNVVDPVAENNGGGN